MPYRPIICAPPTKEWSFTQTAYNTDKRTAIAAITATLPRKAFCPGKYLHSYNTHRKQTLIFFFLET